MKPDTVSYEKKLEVSCTTMMFLKKAIKGVTSQSYRHIYHKISFLLVKLSTKNVF
jgi:hypothetical protein